MGDPESANDRLFGPEAPWVFVDSRDRERPVQVGLNLNDPLEISLRFPQGQPGQREGSWQLSVGNRRIELDPDKRQLVTYGIPWPESTWLSSHPGLQERLRSLDVVYGFDENWRLNERVVWGDSPGLVVQRVRVDREIDRVVYEHLLALVSLPRLTKDPDGYALLYAVTEYDSSGQRVGASYEARLSKGTSPTTTGGVASSRRTAGEETRDPVAGGSLAAKLAETETAIDTLNRVGARMMAQPSQGWPGFPPTVDFGASIRNLVRVSATGPALIYPAVPDSQRPRIERIVWLHESWEQLGVNVVDWGLIDNEARQALTDQRQRLLDSMRRYPVFFRGLVEEGNRLISNAGDRWKKKAKLPEEVDPESWQGILSFLEGIWLSELEQGKVVQSARAVPLAEAAESLRAGLGTGVSSLASGARRRYQAVKEWIEEDGRYSMTRAGVNRTQSLLFGVSMERPAGFTAAEYRQLADAILDQVDDWCRRPGKKPDRGFQERCAGWENWARNLSDERARELPSGVRLAMDRLRAHPEEAVVFLLNTNLFSLVSRSKH